VRLGHLVTRIEYGPSGASVTCANGAVFEADCVIVTTSLGVLQVRHACAPEFEWCVLFMWRRCALHVAMQCSVAYGRQPLLGIAFLNCFRAPSCARNRHRQGREQICRVLKAFTPTSALLGAYRQPLTLIPPRPSQHAVANGELFSPPLPGWKAEALHGLRIGVADKVWCGCSCSQRSCAASFISSSMSGFDFLCDG
jgi:hypothetical protein